MDVLFGSVGSAFVLQNRGEPTQYNHQSATQILASVYFPIDSHDETTSASAVNAAQAEHFQLHPLELLKGKFEIGARGGCSSPNLTHLEVGVQVKLF